MTAAGPRVAMASDRGSSPAELVLVVPALMILIALAMQVVFWALASHAVQASAATGGDVARMSGATEAQALAAARTELSSIAGGLVLSPTVSATTIAGGDEVFSVSGSVPTLIPGVHLRVTATSIGPLELFRGSG
jgi:hypothetical protein